MIFRYELRDKRYGKIFERNQSIEATSKTDARKALAETWRRDIPSDARANGFVPFRDVEILWLNH